MYRSFWTHVYFFRYAYLRYAQADECASLHVSSLRHGSTHWIDIYIFLNACGFFFGMRTSGTKRLTNTRRSMYRRWDTAAQIWWIYRSFGIDVDFFDMHTWGTNKPTNTRRSTCRHWETAALGRKFARKVQPWRIRWVQGAAPCAVNVYVCVNIYIYVFLCR